MRKRAFMLLVGLMLIGIEGYFIFADRWLRLAFAHLGGLGILGFLGLLAGTAAVRKGYGFRRAFILGFAMPGLLGSLAVLAVHLSGGRGCGGIVCLAASFSVIAFYGLVRKKSPVDRVQGQSFRTMGSRGLLF